MSIRIPLVLGTMTFAYQGTNGCRISDKKEVQKVIDSFKSYGQTQLDTARAYGEGTTEQLLSELELSNCTIDSKCYPVQAGDHQPEKLRATLKTILEALKVPKLRIYYLHAPDRATPFEETCAEMNKLYKEGLFEEFGLSNFAAWEVALVWSICDKNGYVKPTVYQGMYNGITRSAEAELIPCCKKLGLRLLCYNPLAGGFFAGKITSPEQEVEKTGRFDPTSKMGAMYRDRYFKQGYFKALEVLKEAVKGTDLTLTEVALRWMQHHSKLDETDGIIIGCSSLAQLEANCKDSQGGPLPDAIVEAVDQAWELTKSDSVPYWR